MTNHHGTVLYRLRDTGLCLCDEHLHADGHASARTVEVTPQLAAAEGVVFVCEHAGCGRSVGTHVEAPTAADERERDRRLFERERRRERAR